MLISSWIEYNIALRKRARYTLSMENFKLIWPLKYISVNQKFGVIAVVYTNLGLKGHDGLDLFAVDGTPVYAAHDGRVIFAGYDSAGGLGIRIRTEETYIYNGQQVYPATIYWHLKKGSLRVTGGETVQKGQLIAEADNTGLSTGSHLHFALQALVRTTAYDFDPINSNNGYRGYIDPTPYLPKELEFKTKVKLGDSGTEVEKIQAFLIRNGFMPPQSVPLGYYGPATRKAIYDFQLKYCNLTVGEKALKGAFCWDKTLKALNEYKEI